MKNKFRDIKIEYYDVYNYDNNEYLGCLDDPDSATKIVVELLKIIKRLEGDIRDYKDELKYKG